MRNICIYRYVDVDLDTDAVHEYIYICTSRDIGNDIDIDIGQYLDPLIDRDVDA